MWKDTFLLFINFSHHRDTTQSTHNCLGSFTTLTYLSNNTALSTFK